jgi:hypothetical protein
MAQEITETAKNALTQKPAETSQSIQATLVPAGSASAEETN